MILETKRCCINPISEQDVPDLEQLYADSKVWQFLGGTRDREQTKTSIARLLFPDDSSRHWAVRLKCSGAFLGFISLAPHHNSIDTEISYLFLSSFWGRGFATEAVQRFVTYILQTLHLTRFVAETQSSNTASCRMLERLSFQEEARLTRFDAEQIIWVYKNS